MTVVEGVLQQSLAVAEATFKTLVPWTSSHYIGHKRLVLKPNRNYNMHTHHEGTQSMTGRTLGKIMGSFEFEAEVRIPASSGADPEIHPWLLASYGRNPSGGEYRLLQRGDAITTLQAGLREPGFYMQGNGIVVTKFTWEMSEDSPPVFKCEGEVADIGGIIGDPAIQAAMSADTDMDFTGAPDEFRKFFMTESGILIQLNDGGSIDDNGGSGYTGNAAGRDKTNLTQSISPAATVGNGSIVEPYLPASSYGATGFVPGIEHELQIDSVAVNFIRMTIEAETGLSLRKKDANAVRANGVYRNARRKISGEMQFYMDNESAQLVFGAGFDDSRHALSLRMGESAAPNNIQHDIPNAAIDVVEDIELPDEEATEYTCTYTAFRNSTDGDELTTDVGL